MLFSRVMVIVAGMLIITAITARINKDFETKREMRATMIGTFALLFGITFVQDQFPLNIILVGLFSGLMGWQIGPTLTSMQKSSALKKYAELHHIEYVKDKGYDMDEQQEQEFELYYTSQPVLDNRNVIISQTIWGCVSAILVTAGVIALTDIDFSFLGIFLFIALVMMIVVGLLNLFIFKSRVVSLVKSYIGVVLFTLYLLYDFGQLEKLAQDETRGTAINIAVNIYLDIINLFLYLLDILSD